MTNASAYEIVESYRAALGKGDFATARTLIQDNMSFQGPLDTVQYSRPVSRGRQEAGFHYPARRHQTGMQRKEVYLLSELGNNVIKKCHHRDLAGKIDALKFTRRVDFHHFMWYNHSIQTQISMA